MSDAIVEHESANKTKYENGNLEKKQIQPNTKFMKIAVYSERSHLKLNERKEDICWKTRHTKLRKKRGLKMRIKKIQLHKTIKSTFRC